EGWAYSNTNYYLLGLIVERISGKSFAEFLEDRILRPLSMLSTRVSTSTEIVKKRATGYSWQTKGWRIEPPVPPVAAFSVGYLLSTVGDLALWDRALSSGEVVGQATLEQMWSPAQMKSGRTYPYG